MSHADGQADMTKPIVAFLIYASSPKNAIGFFIKTDETGAIFWPPGNTWELQKFRTK